MDGERATCVWQSASAEQAQCLPRTCDPEMDLSSVAGVTAWVAAAPVGRIRWHWDRPSAVVCRKPRRRLRFRTSWRHSATRLSGAGISRRSQSPKTCGRHLFEVRPRFARKRLIRNGSPISSERFSRDRADVPGCIAPAMPARRRPVSTAMRRTSGMRRTRDGWAAADREGGAEGDATLPRCLRPTAQRSPSVSDLFVGHAMGGIVPHDEDGIRITPAPPPHHSKQRTECGTRSGPDGTGPRGMTPTTVIPNAGNARGRICCFPERTCWF